jgi:hypothetical protein
VTVIMADNKKLEIASTAWDDAVWLILTDAGPAERAELERVQATPEYKHVVKKGIPADSLDAAILWAIRSTASDVLAGAGANFARAATKLREAAETLDPLAALPRIFPGYDNTTNTLRTFEPFKVLADPAHLHDGLIKLARKYETIAVRLQDERKAGAPVAFGRRVFIGTLDFAARRLISDPLIPALAALHNVLFPDSSIEVDSYRREVKRFRADQKRRG